MFAYTMRTIVVHGLLMLHAATRRGGPEVDSYQVAPMVRRKGLNGAIRGRIPLNTTSDAKGAGRFPDTVQKRPKAYAPDQIRITEAGLGEWG